jgi:hypothetical protein
VLSCGGNTYYVGNLTKGSDGIYRFKAEQDKMFFNGASSVFGVYAMQTFYNDPQDRRISLFWMIDKAAPHLSYDKKWSGLMTLPYENTLKTIDGKARVIQTPVQEVYDLFGKPTYTTENAYTPVLPDMESNAYYIEAVLDMTDAESGGFTVRSGINEQTKVYYTKATGQLTLDTSYSGELASKSDYKYTGGVYSMPMSENPDGTVTLKIFVDTITVEAFGGIGEAAVGTTIFPAKTSNGIEFIGDAKAVSIKIYPYEDTSGGLPSVEFSNIGFAIKTGDGTNDEGMQGLRYSVEIPDAIRNLTIETDGFEVQEYGILAKYSSSDAELLYISGDYESGVGKSISYIKDGKDVGRYKTDDGIVFAGAIISIPEKARDYLAGYTYRPYCVLLDDNGDEHIVYGTEQTSSIYAIAKRAITDYPDNEFINNVIDTVEFNQSDAKDLKVN